MILELTWSKFFIFQREIPQASTRIVEMFSIKIGSLSLLAVFTVPYHFFVLSDKVVHLICLYKFLIADRLTEIQFRLPQVRRVHLFVILIRNTLQMTIIPSFTVIKRLAPLRRHALSLAKGYVAFHQQIFIF